MPTQAAIESGSLCFEQGGSKVVQGVARPSAIEQASVVTRPRSSDELVVTGGSNPRSRARSKANMQRSDRIRYSRKWTNVPAIIVR